MTWNDRFCCSSEMQPKRNKNKENIVFCRSVDCYAVQCVQRWIFKRRHKINRSSKRIKNFEHIDWILIRLRLLLKSVAVEYYHDANKTMKSCCCSAIARTNDILAFQTTNNVFSVFISHFQFNWKLKTNEWMNDDGEHTHAKKSWHFW